MGGEGAAEPVPPLGSSPSARTHPQPLPCREGSNNPHFALTGGPGTGKTTLAAEFARQGFAVAAESGRTVVRGYPEFATAERTPDQQRRFAALVLERDRRTLAWAERQAGPVIFDRKAVDNLGDTVVEEALRPCAAPMRAWGTRWSRCLALRHRRCSLG